ncbi:BspA family leucine-rich repeat surface protein [Dyadobacter sp. CY347]|uniref:BspA family leucine-rich repeat surface protein n=1 Tax=Dyadobacter sp. CY347 TaxID=2909336 RepID=UPI001F19A92A|nr:BspA family leucine-rich repeat surface protein [Dyadobacter sp. CY347]MCF2487717.1 BspA family leucine-rich repeat surface protein [Dyadobacter sp. CY347]
MKKVCTLMLLFILYTYHVRAQYITVWQSDEFGAGNPNQIVIPATGENYSIAWEEIGDAANIGSETGSGNHTLTFPNPGIYQVSITPGSGTFTRIAFSFGTNRKLLEVRQWGDIQWESMASAYESCTNMNVTAIDIPNLQNVTSMASMFSRCPSLRTVPGINNWDVSNVTNMQGMFYLASNFNEPIGDWDVSNVTSMRAMFAFTAFNQPIGSWIVSNVIDMGNMFSGASSFNQSLADWDVSGVIDMEKMFSNANSFNGDVSGWDVGNVVTMNSTFLAASAFNQPIGSWNVSNVTTMYGMLSNATSFNQPLNSWDVSKVRDMFGMFATSPAFNQSLSNWTLSSLTDMTFMLSGSGMDCANMAYTLEGWAANPATPNNIPFGAHGLNYGPPATVALGTLTTTKNWTVSIGSEVTCEALEVSLISFDAKSAGGNVKLEWATASETNNDYFEVERSADMYSWTVIGKTKGAGTVNAVSNYALTDSSPLEGVSYYRLKIVDFAGKADCSNIKAVNIKTGATPSIYPNPATTFLTLSGKTVGYVEIYNLLGKQVGQTKVNAEKTVIPLNGLPAGAYLIKSDDGWHSKFIKN